MSQPRFQLSEWLGPQLADTNLGDRNQSVAQTAERLIFAHQTGVACAPVRDLIGIEDVDIAYYVQQVVVRTRLDAGANVIGRKIGLTSSSVRRQIGVEQPIFGVLLDDMRCLESELVPMHRLLQPKVEAEIAFILATDLMDEVDDPGRLRAAVDCVAPALEIADSRVRDWDIRLTDIIADNASSGLFVLGAKHVRLTDIEPIKVTMTMSKNGQLSSSGSGEDCFGNPMTALAWLARASLKYGSPLRAGDIVLSGALGPMVEVESGSEIVAELSGLGAVSARFSGGEGKMTRSLDAEKRTTTTTSPSTSRCSPGDDPS